MDVPLHQSAAAPTVAVAPDRHRYECQCMRTRLQIVRLGEEQAAIKAFTDVSPCGLGLKV